MAQRLWLVGMMGSGKSAVGVAVARLRSVPFTDTDSLVESRAGMSVRELFSAVGVAAFRDLELQAVEFAASHEGVIATGGGAVIDPRAQALITQSGPVVYLSAAPMQLAARVADIHDRPLLDGSDDVVATLKLLAEQRDPLYRQVADHIVDTSELSLTEVAGEVSRLWTDS